MVEDFFLTLCLPMPPSEVPTAVWVSNVGRLVEQRSLKLETIKEGIYPGLGSLAGCMARRQQMSQVLGGHGAFLRDFLGDVRWAHS